MEHNQIIDTIATEIRRRISDDCNTGDAVHDGIAQDTLNALLPFVEGLKEPQKTWPLNTPRNRKDMIEAIKGIITDLRPRKRNLDFSPLIRKYPDADSIGFCRASLPDDYGNCRMVHCVKVEINKDGTLECYCAEDYEDAPASHYFHESRLTPGDVEALFDFLCEVSIGASSGKYVIRGGKIHER